MVSIAKECHGGIVKRVVSDWYVNSWRFSQEDTWSANDGQAQVVTGR